MHPLKEKKERQLKPTNEFLNYSATNKLNLLAKEPYNLNLLTPDRISRYTAESCGLHFLYGTEKITDEVMSALKELAIESKAIDKMHRMQNGEVVNYIENYPSENRPALHSATRDFFDSPNQNPSAKKAAEAARKEVNKLKTFMEKIDKENKFNEMVMIGIGGSDLGPRAHYYALEYLKKPNRTIHFISNVDPDDVAAVLKKIDPKKCLVLVVSKSGKTVETAVNEDFVRSYFKKMKVDPKKHFISITTPDSPMDNPENYLESFYIWDWIGGRYSTTSMVGGVMIAFAFGFPVFWEFLKGAHAMDKAALKSNINQNLPLLAALLGIWNRHFLKYPTVALIPYSQALLRYPAHIQQLDMESNGKSIDQKGNFVKFETGPVIWGEPGTNAQHSFFQLIHQGTSIIPVSMIGFKESQYGEDIEVNGTTSQEKLLSNLFAQSIALAIGQRSDNPNTVFPGNRPTHIILGKKLTPEILGSLLAFFEHMVAFQGFIWGINSFDQEGVQLGKLLANKILDRFVAKEKGELDNNLYPLGDAFLQQLDKI